MARLRRRKSAYLASRLRKLAPDEVETLARAAELLDRMREDEQG
jgi:Asp-tRNA(Asn)/Glu-tRNA(Gln) amidotransferase C subunit